MISQVITYTLINIHNLSCGQIKEIFLSYEGSWRLNRDGMIAFSAPLSNRHCSERAAVRRLYTLRTRKLFQRVGSKVDHASRPVEVAVRTRERVCVCMCVCVSRCFGVRVKVALFVLCAASTHAQLQMFFLQFIAFHRRSPLRPRNPFFSSGLEGLKPVEWCCRPTILNAKDLS